MSYRKSSSMRATLRLTLSLAVIAFLGWLTLPYGIWNRLEPRARAASTFVVTTADDNGDNLTPIPGSLRKAIIDANNTVGTDTITFQIGSGLQTIKPKSELPAIIDPVIIDGTTQPGFAGKPLIFLNGSEAGEVGGLTIGSGDSTVRGLIISSFRYRAIELHTRGNNLIAGNFIGTNATGTDVSGTDENNGIGIIVYSHDNIIGGTSAADRNVIAGNKNSNGGGGIWLYGGGVTGNKVIGNYIGTDVTGTVPLYQNNNGVYIIGGASSNIVGGSTAAERNIIYHASTGVGIDSGAHDNKVQGNYIGTRVDGTGDLDDVNLGIFVGGGAHDNLIGGTSQGEGNLVAYSTGPGVTITGDTTINNAVLGNSINLSKNGSGIDLKADGVTPNDLGATINDPSDADTGPNNLQNFPELTSVATSAGNLVIDGTLRSQANKTYRIELFSNTSCDSSGYGEGERFVASANAVTNASGNINFNFTIPAASVTGTFFTVTATDSNNNTSEFSQCKSSVPVNAGVIQFGNSSLNVGEAVGTALVTVTRSGGSNGAVSVSYATADFTAKAGSDYTAKSGQIDFADGETSKQISISIANDPDSEPSESFVINLSNPTNGATLGPQTQIGVFIGDNDAPSISINNVQVQEGNSGTTDATFTVSIGAPHYKSFTVDYATVTGGTATSGNDFQPTTGTLTFNIGETSKPVTVLVNGDPTFEPNETFIVQLSNNTELSITKDKGTGTITNDDAQGGTIALSSATYSIKEGTVNTPQGFTSLSVNVNRTGDTSGAVTVQYFTSDTSGGNECDQVTGQASQRCDYAMVAGTLRFAAGESTKQVQIPIINDGYVEGSEVFKINLQNAVGATLGAITQATATITDSGNPATTGANNPYLSNEFFVRQNYLDYLGRDADQSGFTDWTTVLNNCGPQKGFLGAPPNCDRAHVSHGFFGSPEFTDKGFLIYRMYEVGLGRLPLYNEFIPDMATLSGFGIPASIEQQNLQDYLESFSQRQDFINRFSNALQPSQAATLIQKLEQAAIITLPATATTNPGQPTQYGRNELIQKRASGQFTVGQTLKAFVEQQAVYDKYFPRGFVTMEYFAHLRRDPNLNDPNLVGWNDWVDVFTNGKPGAGIQPKDYHHLIFGFIYSTEYRKRFGQP